MSSTLNLTGFKLTFDDEFNSFVPAYGSVGTWQTQYWWGRTNAGNAEQEYYSDSSVGVNPFSVTNGALDIAAAPSSNPSATGGLPYTSGIITTYGSFQQTYGYFEMRAKLPAGQGLWPAFWMLPSDRSWPPEIDVMEMLGQQPTVLHSTVHSNSTGAHTMSAVWAIEPDLSAAFHTYGVDWEPQDITFYFDGTAIGQVATPSDLDKPMYMIANLAVGGSWGGYPDGTTIFPAHMDIDYIRAYSNAPSANAVALDTVSSPDGVNTSNLHGATSAPPSNPTNTPPAPVTTGTGSDTLVVSMSEDAYQGDAQFTVAIDGKQLGSSFTTTALHTATVSQNFIFKGDWAIGAHTVTLNFLNDAWDGTAATDRNLYLNELSYDGAATGQSAAFMSAGPKTFSVTDTTPIPGVTLTGTAGNDTLTGGIGTDTLIGLGGNDTLTPEKGCHNLIKAFNRVPTNKRLVIAGRGTSPDYVRSLELTADPSKVIFVGFRDGNDLAELFSNAFLHVLPSYIEGMSMSLLESLAYGVPSLVSDIEENMEVIGQNGFRFKTGDDACLERELGRLVANPSVVVEASSRLASIVLSGWDVVASQYATLYDRVLQRRNAVTNETSCVS